MNSLYGEQIRKDIEESFACQSEVWIMSECDERVKDYSKIAHGNYIVEMTDDKGLEDEVKKLKTMPLHLAFCIIKQ